MFSSFSFAPQRPQVPIRVFIFSSFFSSYFFPFVPPFLLFPPIGSFLPCLLASVSSGQTLNSTRSIASSNLKENVRYRVLIPHRSRIRLRWSRDVIYPVYFRYPSWMKLGKNTFNTIYTCTFLYLKNIHPEREKHSKKCFASSINIINVTVRMYHCFLYIY